MCYYDSVVSYTIIGFVAERCNARLMNRGQEELVINNSTGFESLRLWSVQGSIPWRNLVSITTTHKLRRSETWSRN